MDDKENNLTEFVEVFNTAQLWQMDMAQDTLKQANVPHFVRQESFSGVRTAFPVAPSPGPGNSFTLLVPKPALKRTKQLLAPLPISLHKHARYWDTITKAPSAKETRFYFRLLIGALIAIAIYIVLRIVGIVD
jgi:hypothetical protein